MKYSPSSSFLQVNIPLSTDMAMRTAVSDLGSWSTFRLSKFYELVDALTADVVYRHFAELPVAWVTAGHYFSRKIKRTDIATDVTIRSYITKVGRSSVEVRTDGIQNDEIINVCHTTMVALDRTGRSMGSSNDQAIVLPALAMDDEDTGQAERLSLAKWHDTIRKHRAQSTMQLRTKISFPPTNDEVQALHELHRTAIHMTEMPKPRPPWPRTVAEYTFHSSVVIFPEDRNVHGKLFGGYVMSQAYNLALYAVKFFARSSCGNDHDSIIPLGIDEAVFHQPIAIGDLVTFTARVVHATEFTCRVFVTVSVRDPSDTERLPQRSNRLMFVFCAKTPHEVDGVCNFVLPNTYSEVLMHLEAERRYNVEGPSEEEAHAILEESLL
jgi:acyl-coenzyme A thioesterase 9